MNNSNIKINFIEIICLPKIEKEDYLIKITSVRIIKQAELYLIIIIEEN